MLSTVNKTALVGRLANSALQQLGTSSSLSNSSALQQARAMGGAKEQSKAEDKGEYNWYSQEVLDMSESELKKLYPKHYFRYSPRQFSNIEQPVRERPNIAVYPENPYENSLYYRKMHLYREFKWTRRNAFEATWTLGIWGIGIVMLMDYGQDFADRRSGYPKRGNIFWDYEWKVPDPREFYGFEPKD